MQSSLLLFGDSVGRGVVFDSIEKKYHLLKESFARLVSQQTGKSILNYACFGCTVTKGIRNVQKRAERDELSGTVILEFGGNDCDFLWNEISDSPESEHFPKTPMNQFIGTYSEMIEKVRDSGCTPVLMTLPPIDSQRYFARVSENLSQRNILKWLGNVERIYSWHEYYSLAVYRLAIAYNTQIIDVRSAFLQRKDIRELICEDGIHPTAKGHALISEVVSRFFIPGLAVMGAV